MSAILLETNLTLDENALNALLNALPPTWRARAQRYKPFDARVRSAVGYTLLSRILREQYELTDLPMVDTDEHGKPFLVDIPLYFSISHCQAAVACIVAPHPVGIDVQDMLSDVSPTLAARIAAPQDPADISSGDLTALWAQKEASAKLDGRGLKIGLEHLPLPQHRLTVEKYDDFVLCVARRCLEYTDSLNIFKGVLL